MGTQRNHLNETIFLSTQNICSKWWIRKYLEFYTQKFCLSEPLIWLTTWWGDRFKNDKQLRSWSDCSFKSSLIWLYTVLIRLFAQIFKSKYWIHLQNHLRDIKYYSLPPVCGGVRQEKVTYFGHMHLYLNTHLTVNQDCSHCHSSTEKKS